VAKVEALNFPSIIDQTNLPAVAVFNFVTRFPYVTLATVPSWITVNLA